MADSILTHRFPDGSIAYTEPRKYRLFKTAVATVKVAGCKDCPGKKAHRYQDKAGWLSLFVCAQTEIDATVEGGLIGKIHPDITVEIFNESIRKDCPLPIYQSPEELEKVRVLPREEDETGKGACVTEAVAK